MATALSPTRYASPLGRPVDRIDGPAKATGAADYAAEHNLPGLVHAAVVQSTIAAGRIAAIDTERAEHMPGVLAVLTHDNAPRLKAADRFPAGGAAMTFLPLQDDLVRFNGQHIALVVADTLERATEAANAVHVEYAAERPITGIDDPAAIPVSPDAIGGQAMDIQWGDPDAALAAAAVRVEATYTTPREYNNPIEPHATVARWDDAGNLTVWEPSQWVEGGRQAFAQWFDLPIEQVRLISPFVGGGFGCKACAQPHAALAAMAARHVGRPVKLVLSRPQTFTGYGGRPATRQHFQLGADTDGKLQAMLFEGANETSMFDAYMEPGSLTAKLLYQTPNYRSTQKLVRANIITPSWMRAPGEAVGTFALESAMDELAYAVGLDPIELRLRNWTDKDPHSGKPWSSRRLREAYAAGAHAIGWHRRSPQPRSMRQGRRLIGLGMATGTYPVYRTPAEARVRVTSNGTIEVLSGGADIGTGLYTIIAQTAAEVFGVEAHEVTVHLGDTTLPRAPLAGGSQLSGDVLPVVQTAAQKVRDQLLSLAAHELRANDLVVEKGRVVRAADPSQSLSFADLVSRSPSKLVEADHDNLPVGANSEEDRRATFNTATRMQFQPSDQYSMHSWSAQFAEVHVDEDFGTIRVKRMVGAFDSGRLYNPKTAESQLQGGMIMGLGMALLEAANVDHRYGRIVNNNLAEYMVPVNADVPEIEIISVGEPDFEANPLGGKAVGEVGITGVAAAIANAVYHATGKRIRDLPITLEKLI